MSGIIELDGDDPLPAEEVRFTVAYDGPALANGRMSMLDLAPAMLSTARMVEDGARLLFGPTAGIKIEVNADFRRGSFAFDVFTGPDAARQAKDILSHISLQQIEFLLKWLGLTGGAGGGVFGLIKWLRNRQVKSVEQGEAVDSARIVLHDGQNITVNVNVAVLTLNQTIRQDADGVIEPLRRPGITEFRAGRGLEAEQIVRGAEADYFIPPALPERELQDRVTEEIVEVVSPTFRDGNKWRFAQGDAPFYAAVLDKEFIRRVNRHEFTFGKGDALRVQLRSRVTQTPDGLSADREITKVLEYLPPPKQGDLFEPPPEKP